MARPSTTIHIAVSLLLIATVMVSTTNAMDDNVREACKATRHPTLCVRTLSPFSRAAGRSPHRWARAAVSVALAETERVRRDLSREVRARIRAGSPRAQGALADCAECFGDAVGELWSSLMTLRTLRAVTFGPQMGDVETWVSAALTDVFTCVDGLKEVRWAAARAVEGKAVNVTCLASNALALVNRLAVTGAGSLNHP
ncbi:hypothetical protein QJS10_CPA05g00396 [Acorus calamus]|uniref:Pectinesterase inhibitor domain-containing protein n=1 Tax=Acorus calamus TaxID=4465 RepID=A0AAV9ETZ5_ACOCL|nr:hypothetical protein QJS10_CPA05g00396 [Acorus calamus]